METSQNNNKSIASEKSPVDQLFNELMGYYPAKAGKAYEIISSAVLSIVTGKDAIHDNHQKGKSDTDYQIDGLLDGKIMVEAKDYTIQNKKVGRGDLQKMQGGLTDLPQIESGIFTSATPYTGPALKYAVATEGNEMQKKIVTAEIRPCLEEDRHNRIEEIQFNLTLHFPDFNQASYSICYEDGEWSRLKKLAIERGLTTLAYRVYDIYDAEGGVLTSVRDLSNSQPPEYEFSDALEEVEGKFEIDGYVKVLDHLFHINGIRYKVPIVTLKDVSVIKKEGNPKILIKSEKLGINKLIVDRELKEKMEAIINKS